MLLKTVWSILFFGGLLWYVYTIITVGIKGYTDLKEMLLNINKK